MAFPNNELWLTKAANNLSVIVNLRQGRLRVRGSREMKRYGGGGRIMKLYLVNVRDAIFFYYKV